MAFLDKAGAAYFAGKINSIFAKKSLGKKVFTAQDKNGTAIIGSANDAAGASFYFGRVKPTEFKTPWEITYRIKAFCANDSNYQQSATVRLFGAGTTRAGFETTNDIYSTSYRAAYYHNLYSLQSAGFTNGYGHLIGVGLNSSTNPTNASYPRTIEVDILDVKNGTFEFFDYALKYANVPGTGTTNFNGLSQWDFANNGHKPNDNTVSQLRTENGRIYAGAGGIMNYSLCCLDKDGKWQSLTTTSGTGATKTINTGAKFVSEPSIVYYAANNSATNGNLVANTYVVYSAYANLDLRYSTNTTTTAFTGNSPIYIECTFDSDGNWSPTTNCITQTLRQGYYYIFLGLTYSTVYQLTLFTSHPVYYYDGSKLVEKKMSYNSLTDKPTIPSAVTSSTVSGWGFTKNTGTYSKPSGGIPKTDLAAAVQTSLGKADSALQSVPTASATQLGGIKVGSGLSISNGILSATGGGSSVLKFSNISVPKTAWVDNNDDELPYKANVALTGVTSSLVPDVIFDTRNMADDVAECVCEVCESYNGGITLYAYGPVSENLTISSISCL